MRVCASVVDDLRLEVCVGVCMRACVCVCASVVDDLHVSSSIHLPLSCPKIREYTLLNPNTFRKYQLIELTLIWIMTKYSHSSSINIKHRKSQV